MDSRALKMLHFILKINCQLYEIKLTYSHIINNNTFEENAFLIHCKMSMFPIDITGYIKIIKLDQANSSLSTHF